MMISGSELGSVVSTYLREPPKAQGQPAQGAAAPASSAGDGVTLSPKSEAVTRLLSALHELPDMRSDRVLAARGRIESGQAPAARDVAKMILARVVGDHLAGG